LTWAPLNLAADLSLKPRDESENVFVVSSWSFVFFVFQKHRTSGLEIERGAIFCHCSYRFRIDAGFALPAEQCQRWLPRATATGASGSEVRRQREKRGGVPL